MCPGGIGSPEPVSDLERTLLRAFEMDPDAPDPGDA